MRAILDDRSNPQQPRIRRDLVRLAIAAVLLVVGFLGSTAASVFRAAEKSISERGLLREGARLESDLAGLRSRIDTLGHALAMVIRPAAFRAAVATTGKVVHAGADLAGPDGAAPGAFQPPGAVPLATYATTAAVDDLLRRARLLAFSWREAGDELKRKYDDLASTPSLRPTSGYIASTFSWSRWHPILGRPRPHLGVDIVAPAGTPVVAAARGRVAFVGRRGEYGNIIEVDHGYGRLTRYAHLSRIEVRVGQWVDRGQSIGRVGSTGLAQGAHLHYEVLINGRPANPRPFIIEGGATTN